MLPVSLAPHLAIMKKDENTIQDYYPNYLPMKILGNS